MMSNPPQYSRELEDEESAPLWKGDVRSSLELEATSYPPRLGQSSIGDGEERVSVNYTFEPRWPLKGKEQSAIGVLGRTKAVSILCLSSISLSCQLTFTVAARLSD